MRTYRVEYKDPRDDMCLNIDDVRADLFIVDDHCTTVTFFVENSNSSMTPVAMFPFSYVVSINSEPAEVGATEEGDSE